MVLTELDYQGTIQAPVPNTTQELSAGEHERKRGYENVRMYFRCSS